MPHTIALRVCVDVDDIDKAIAFYTGVFGLRVGRRLDASWIELLGASSPIDLLENRAGTRTSNTTFAVRSFERHWTPVHLDFTVDDIDATTARAVAAGATLERAIRDEPYGRLANLADPFGHGICLLEFNDHGYDALTGDAVVPEFKVLP